MQIPQIREKDKEFNERQTIGIASLVIGNPL